MNSGIFKKKYSYVCEAQVMSAFTVKQYSLTTCNSQLFTKKQNSDTALSILSFTFHYKFFFSSPQNSLYIKTIFFIYQVLYHYLFERAIFKSTKFTQKTVFLGSNVIWGGLFFFQYHYKFMGFYIFTVFQSTVAIIIFFLMPVLTHLWPVTLFLKLPSVSFYNEHTVKVITSLLSGMT